MDVTVKRIEEMDSAFDGAMVKVRASLGVTSFGMQIENMPPNWDGYPEHDEVATGQEEVYVILEGSARLLAGGAEFELDPETFARVGPKQRRKLVPGAQGARVLVIGAIPGRPFEIQPWSELGPAAPNLI